MLRPWLLWTLLFLFHSFLTPISHCQTNSPQNKEVFFPNVIPAPSPSPNSPTETPGSLPPPVAAPSRSSTSNGKIAKAVAITAAATLVVSGFIFFLIHRCLTSRRKKQIANNAVTAAPPGDRRVVPQGNVFERIDGNVRGLIVDENGLDVVYWRKLEGRNSKKELQKEVFHNEPEYKQRQKKEAKEDEEDDDSGNDEGFIGVKKSKSIQVVPLLRGKSSTSHINILPEEIELNRVTSRSKFPVHTIANLPASVEKPDSPPQPSTPPPPVSPATPSPSPATSLSDIPKSESRPPPPPPPTPDRKNSAPPPPPPPIPANKSSAPPPPPPKPSSKPPPTPSEMPDTASKSKKLSEDGTSESGNGQLKLKPLHWDKVNTNNVDHSMVWDKIDRGSLRYS